MYSDFSLAEGGTYIAPGTARTPGGAPLFCEGADLAGLLETEPGLVAVNAPAGSCLLTDTRVLHCGGRRDAPGTRYALRVHYQRGHLRPLHEQSNQNLHVPVEYWQLMRPRLRQLMRVESFSEVRELPNKNAVRLADRRDGRDGRPAPQERGVVGEMSLLHAESSAAKL